MNRREAITMIGGTTITAITGCFSAPRNTTTETDTGARISDYPSAMSGDITVVSPDADTPVLERSAEVLTSNFEIETEYQARTERYAQFDRRNGSFVVFALNGALPTALEEEFDYAASQEKRNNSATISMRINPWDSAGHVIIINGDAWGIRAAADTLAGRSTRTIDQREATVTAELSRFSGELDTRLTSTSVPTFVTEDGTQYYIAVDKTNLTTRNAVTNTTVIAYETKVLLHDRHREGDPIIQPALEIVSKAPQNESKE